MKTYYSFDDIFLFPRYSDCTSRSEIDSSVTIGDFKLKVPIISSNMDTVTESHMASTLWEAGAVGALHRFMDVKENVCEYGRVRDKRADCFVSVGINENNKERSRALYAEGARHFIIDVAHGHSELMKDQLSWMREEFGDTIYIVAGNVATPGGVRHLHSWGADCIKVGVGGGSCCKTRVVTGHGVPMFSCLLECCETADENNIKVIADGGIRSSGDIVKSLATGANLVMLGSLLAGTTEAPGEITYTPDGPSKDFRGMASQLAMENRYGSTRVSFPTAEGVATRVSCKGPVKDVINHLALGLKSGMSYCGAQTISEIPIKARWGIQSYNGFKEGIPHIIR